MTITRCRHCLAWEPHSTATREAHDLEARGYCRRRAPSPTFSGLLNGMQGEVCAEFPVTMNSDGCCEGVADVWSTS